MNNLIITIISIALVAVAAIMAAFYGGVAFENNQYNASASALITQNEQILAAANLYASATGTTDFGTIGMNSLYTGGYLSTFPELAGFGPLPYQNNPTTAVYESGCPVVSGYKSWISRSLMSYGGINYIEVFMKLNDPYNGTCWLQNAGNGYGFESINYANHPYILLAKAINKALGTVPSGATIAPSGIPYAPNGYSQVLGTSLSGWGYLAVSGGVPVVGYCVLDYDHTVSNQTQISCLFSS